MIDLNYKKHKLESVKGSKYIFYCKKCNNIIKYSSSLYYDYIYYLDYEKGGFFPLNDCNEIIIKNILE